MTDAIDGLIEKLEAAEGADPLLDKEIFEAFGRPLPDEFSGVPIKLRWDDGQQKYVMSAGEMQFSYTPAPYTKSIDAALTLKPDNWFIDFLTEVNSWPKPRFSVELWRPPINEISEGHVKATHNDLAIALCIAALKALRARKGGEG